MVNNQLLEYIEAELKNGSSRDNITQTLKNVGWVEIDINEAFRLLGTPISPKTSLLGATDYHDAEAAPFRGSASASTGPITPEEINRAVAAHMASASVPTDESGALLPKTMPAASANQISPTHPSDTVSTAEQIVVTQPTNPTTPAHTLSESAPSPSQNSSLLTQDSSLVATTRHGHPWVIAGVVAVSLLIVAGSVFGYVYWWKAEVAPSGDLIGELIVKNISQVKSFAYDGTISLSVSLDNNKLWGASVLPFGSSPTPSSIKNNETTEGSAVIHIIGMEDWSDAEQKKTQTNTSFDVKGGGNPAVAFAFAIESRGVGDIAYVKFNDIPFLDFFGLGNFQNQWLLVDPQTLLQNIDSGVAGYYRDAIAQDKRQQDNVSKNIVTVLASRNIIRYKNNPESSELNGIPVYKYRATIDVDELMQALIAVAELNTGQRVSAEERKSISAARDYVRFDEGEVWVGRKDFLPYRMSMKVSIVDSVERAFSGTITVESVFKDYNRPVDILVPSNAKPIDQIIKEMMSVSSMGDAFGQGMIEGSPILGGESAVLQARAKARDARRIADIKQLQLALELYYDNNDQSYPQKLSELVPKYIPQVHVPPQPSSALVYFYVPLSAKGGACAAGACSSYHLGAALEGSENFALISDSDLDFDSHLIPGGFAGKSSKCGKKTEVTDLCFDVRYF
jgi:hypothetical protein